MAHLALKYIPPNSFNIKGHQLQDNEPVFNQTKRERF